MTQAPLVSIITVVYNGEKHLKQSIESVINQSYENIEYIIIDGGSTDGTLDIIKRYEKHINYWVSEPDNGLYEAMNKGIKVASGELIGTVNSDDWYESHTVKTVVNAYLSNKVKRIFHGDRYDIYPNGSKKIFKFNPSVLKFKYYAMTYSHPTMFVHREIYENSNYNISLTSISDFQFVLEMYLKDKTMFHYISRPLSNFRLGGTSGQLSLKELLKQNYMARKNAGMNFFQCVMAVSLRASGEVYRKIKNLVINKK